MDPSARSDLMRSIRSSGTKPELMVMREMRRRKIWFQAHYPRATGTPDLARPRDRLAVFIDGDYWHGRELPRVIDKYGVDSAWAMKLRRNVARDRDVDAQLALQGWQVLRVWESDLRRAASRDIAFDQIAYFLNSKRS